MIELITDLINLTTTGIQELAKIIGPVATLVAIGLFVGFANRK